MNHMNISKMILPDLNHSHDTSNSDLVTSLVSSLSVNVVILANFQSLREALWHTVHRESNVVERLFHLANTHLK